MSLPDASTRRPHSEFAHRRWPADPRALPGIRDDVRGWLAPLPLTDGARQDLVLAVSEAASNVLEHAYPAPGEGSPLELTYWIDGGRVWLEIVDRGTWKAPEDPVDGHGLGIPMMQRLVDSVMIQYGGRGTSVLMSHPLPGREREQPEHPIAVRFSEPG